MSICALFSRMASPRFPALHARGLATGFSSLTNDKQRKHSPPSYNHRGCSRLDERMLCYLPVDHATFSISGSKFKMKTYFLSLFGCLLDAFVAFPDVFVTRFNVFVAFFNVFVTFLQRFLSFSGHF